MSANAKRKPSAPSEPPKKRRARATTDDAEDASAKVALEPAEDMVIYRIRLHQIEPSPYNPRRIDDEDPWIDELAQSIRTIGLAQPILVRPKNAPGEYQIVFGECRWRATRVAGKFWINCMVRELTDRQARELIITENLKRADLLPLEEGTGVADLLELYGDDIRAVARTLGKGVPWVTRRARLRSLSDNWREWLADRQNADRIETWSIGHYEAVARLAPDAQDDFLDEFANNECRPQNLLQFEEHLARRFHFVKHAKWDLTDQILVDGLPSCEDCFKRTSNHPGLFDDNFGPILDTDRCMDHVCWMEKQWAWVRRRATELREAHGDVVLVAEQSSERIPHDLDVRPPWRGRPAQQGDVDAVPALTVLGAGLGEVEWMSFPGRKPKIEPAAEPPTAEERQAALEVRRQRRAIELLVECLPVSATFPSPEELIRLALIFGSTIRRDSIVADDAVADDWLLSPDSEAIENGVASLGYRKGWPFPRLDQLKRLHPRVQHWALWRRIAAVIAGRLRYLGVDLVPQQWAEARIVATWIKENLDALKARADAEIPDLSDANPPAANISPERSS